jgi:hypothetical protein
MSATTRKLGGIVPTLYAATLTLLSVASPSTTAQVASPSAPAENTSQTNLLNAYRQAFQAYARDDAEAAAQEYKGEPGDAKRDTLRVQFDLTVEQFSLFQNAALEYRSFMKLIEGRVDAVVQADRVLHPATKGPSPEATTKVHSLFDELAQRESESVHFIHQSMDTHTAQKLDDAVARFEAESQAHDLQPRQPQPPTARMPSLAFAARPAVLSSDPCSDPTIICSTCSPDLDPDCGVDDGGGDGGGGGGPYPPTITSIDPTTIALGTSSVLLTIYGTDLASSPTVYLPAGVTSSGQVTSDSRIVVTVSVGYDAAVGNNNVSVTTTAGSSNAATLVLNGPSKMVVQSDVIGPGIYNPNEESRFVEYQVQNYDNTAAANIPIAESITLSGYNCTQNNPGNITAQCNAQFSTDSNGYFTDEWGMYTGYTPATCGQNITDHWQWCAPANNNPPAPNTGVTFGTLKGFIGVSSTTINNHTNPPSPMPQGFVINP